jgi:hypothetical protein
MRIGGGDDHKQREQARERKESLDIDGGGKKEFGPKMANGPILAQSRLMS